MTGAPRATLLVGLLVFLAVTAVYLITLTPTVPFWDAGEFIAVSYILGIPHPPGTPFYVLLGRVATLIPWQSIAERVNALSAIPAAIAVTLTYLTLVKLVRLSFAGADEVKRRAGDRWKAVARRGHAAETAGAARAEVATGAASVEATDKPLRWGWQEVVTHLAAVTGALMLAFSDSFWENSTEAEVYSLMSCAQALVLWLGMRWWEEHERRPTVGPLLLAVYVMWLCVGLHLGVGIMGMPLLLLILLVDRNVALVFAMPCVGVLLVTMGLERMAGGVILMSVITWLIFASRKQLPPMLAWGAAAAAILPLGVAFGDQSFTTATAVLAALAVLVPMAALAWRTREGRVIALAFLLMFAGYSTHVYLPIRAAQHPAINEGNPETWDSLRDLLERKQYGEMNMFVRRAPLSVQLDKEFWRYFSRQWPLFPSPALWAVLLPLLIGIAGGAWLAQRNRIAFLYIGCFLGLTTAGMILFLNFSPQEVRDRDYFFQSGYHAFAILMGLGTAWAIGWVRESFGTPQARRTATVVTAAALAAMPLLLLRNLWFTHDRHGDYVARDYAYNMLAPLAPNSFMFTNGDNDTFPLWYLQEVEGIRKDVRVVNLSLLNTDWYIQQLRDEEPRVPIDLTDDQIRSLGMGAVRDSTGNIIYTSNFMVAHIMNQNRTPEGGWHKQPYFAVTVPDHMNLDKHFTLEGLVYKVAPDSGAPAIDPEATHRALYDIFRYRGLFFADGTWDSTVYKDENASTLSRNYMAAHIQLAFHYRRQGDLDRALAEMERVRRMFPDEAQFLVPLGTFYMERGDTAKALELFAEISRRNPNDPEARYYHAVLLSYRGQVDQAVAELDQVIRLDPGYSMAYYAAYLSLLDSGQPERALTYLERWVQSNPNDGQAQALLDQQRRALGAPSAPSPPPPPIQGLP